MLLCALVFSAANDCSKVVTIAFALGMNTKNPSMYSSLNLNCCSNPATLGVTCHGSSSTSTVTEIDWSAKGLTGSLSSNLIFPSSLTKLALQRNLEIKGDLLFMANLPNGILYLDMNNNQLTGFIPIVSPSLKYLSLYNNQLTGAVPQIPAGIESLLLSMNPLSGDMPTIPASVNVLEIHHTQLSGSIQLSKPITIYIDYTQISFIAIDDASLLNTGICHLGQSLLFYNDIAHLNGICDLAEITMTRPKSTSVRTTATLSTKASILLTISNAKASLGSSIFLKVNQITTSTSILTSRATPTAPAIITSMLLVTTSFAKLNLNSSMTFSNTSVDSVSSVAKYGLTESQIGKDDTNPSESTLVQFVPDIYFFVAIGSFVVLVFAVLIASRFLKTTNTKSKFGRKNSFGTLNTVATNEPRRF